MTPVPAGQEARSGKLGGLRVVGAAVWKGSDSVALVREDEEHTRIRTLCFERTSDEGESDSLVSFLSLSSRSRQRSRLDIAAAACSGVAPLWEDCALVTASRWRGTAPYSQNEKEENEQLLTTSFYSFASFLHPSMSWMSRTGTDGREVSTRRFECGLHFHIPASSGSSLPSSKSLTIPPTVGRN